ncbi:MAG TPA: PQQ-binding-like beta-propeller repeat protein [Candidatus Thermoplasmatota archaeon]|nr:PQQ-binding-like beta-propeller repeat protein [Candidatus Thermoplasmatota archaeon]
MINRSIWKKYGSFCLVVFLVSLPIITSVADRNDSTNLIQSPDHFFNNPRGNDWWPMFRHDEAHSGVSTTTTRNDNHLLWSYQTNFIISSSPAVSHGRVYVGSWDWNLYCFEMDSGTILWNYSTNSEITSSPAVADGKVYFGSQNTNLYCLNAINGSFLWSFKTDFIIDTSPTVVDGKVFFGSSDGSLYCLDSTDGSLIWGYQTNSVIVSSAAVVDGKVYVGVTNGNFLCLNSTTGAIIWTFTTTGGIYSSPNLNEGKIYYGSNDGNVYCLDADDGSLLWNYSAFSEIHSSPAVAYDSVYIGTNDGRLLCLNKDTGGFAWSYQISGSVSSSPAVADGKVYFDTDPCCGFTSYLVCLNAYTGAKIWDYNFNTQFQTRSSPALAAGKVFVGSGDGILYSFGDIQFLADANGPYHGIINTSVDFIGSVYGGQAGFSWYWDFGDGATSIQQHPTHTYTALGEYTVTLSVTDNLGHIATDDTEVFIEVPNTSPEIPTVDGPVSGRPGMSYEFFFTSSDQTDDTLYYYIDWGDTTTSGWIGPFPSGVTQIQQHTWTSKGSFMIKVKAKDKHGAESNWSDPFGIGIIAPELDIKIQGGFGITVTILNTGDAPATDVSWNITFENGIVFPALKNGLVATIPAGGQAPIKVLVFGFGKKQITISVVCNEETAMNKIVNVSLLLFFVFGIK